MAPTIVTEEPRTSVRQSGNRAMASIPCTISISTMATRNTARSRLRRSVGKTSVISICKSPPLHLYSSI